MQRLKVVLSFFALVISMPSLADIKTDKTAGECLAYLAAQKKESGAEQALSMADNQAKAMQFARTWLKEANRFKSDKAALQAIFFKADGSCRDIGIRPADF